MYFAVQAGGDFQISYSIHDPDDKAILAGHGERQLDVVFTAQKEGEYVVCFNNDHSSYDSKLVSRIDALIPVLQRTQTLCASQSFTRSTLTSLSSLSQD